MTDLFGSNDLTINASSHSLAKTGELTMFAEGLAKEAFINMSKTDKGQTTILESYDSLQALKVLASSLVIDQKSIGFMKGLDETTVTKMLKSQQSKVSRTRSKEQSTKNYITLLTGAICEHVIRTVYNIVSISRGASRSGVKMTEEEYQVLFDNQDDLKKAIRNVQSKKSIAKSRADFEPDGVYWKELLEHERRLKELRIDSPKGTGIRRKTETVKVTKIEELLKDIDPTKVGKAKGAELLTLVQEALSNGEIVEQESTN